MAASRPARIDPGDAGGGPGQGVLGAPAAKEGSDVSANEELIGEEGLTTFMYLNTSKPPPS